MVGKGKELYLKARAKIQKAKLDATATAIKTIKTINCDREEQLCFDDIDKAVKDRSAKSEEVFELIYELVEDSEMATSHKSKKRQWNHTFTGDKMFQYTHQTNKKNWDTGIINKFLKDTHKSHKDRKKCEYIHAALRAEISFGLSN